MVSIQKISLAALFVLGTFQNALGFSCPAGAPCLGMNRFELGSQFLENNWQGNPPEEFDRIALNMTLKSLRDATWDGVSYFRFSAADFGPVTRTDRGILKLWVQDKDAFFAKYDRLFDEAERRGVMLVPVLIWNLAQFPALAGDANETVDQMLKDPNSSSHRLAVNWVRDFVSRYKDRTSVLFWELSNEWNLQADSNTREQCWTTWGRDHAFCQVVSNYSTDSLIAFAEVLRQAIKSEDPSRKVSTGYGYPNPYAQNLRRRPQWTWGSGGGLKEDSTQESETYLRDTHRNFEILSVHHYAQSRLQNRTNRELLQYVHAFAQRNGQELFVGEYGAPNGPKTGEVAAFTSSSYLMQTLRDILSIGIRWSAAWIYQFYQNSPTAPNEFNIEQGMTDSFLEDFRSHTFRVDPASRPAGPIAPSLLIQFPPNNSDFDAPFSVVVSAGDDSGKIESIKFMKSSGQVLRSVVRPPYSAVVDPREFSLGRNTILVEACDYEGNCHRESMDFVRLPGAEPETRVTCLLSVEPLKAIYEDGEDVTFSLKSEPAGLKFRFLGLPKEFGSSADSDVTPTDIRALVDTDNRSQAVVRWAEVLDASGEIACTTNRVRLRTRRQRDPQAKEAALQMGKSHQGARIQ